MRAYVRLSLPNGHAAELGHGDLIGRLWSAALCISDARISEAHAMVSLRGEELLLLPLRGRFSVGGQRQTSLVLAAGQRISFADGLEVLVEEVSLPAAVFAVEGDGLPRVVVSGVCSLLIKPRPELVPNFVADAPAHLWGDGEGWCLTMRGVTRSLQVGDRWELEGRQFRAVGLALGSAGRTVTRHDTGGSPPLRIVAQFDTVHIHREDGSALALSGLAARLISEIVAFDGPVSWEVLAKELWPQEDDLHLLRHKLDVTLSRLRARLRDAQIRPDLIRSDGFGKVELFLLAVDRVEDRT